MLVLGREIDESITLFCGDVQIEITLVKVQPQKVRLGISAPNSVRVVRSELLSVGGANGDTTPPTVPV